MNELKIRAWHKSLNEFVRLDKYTVLTADGIAPIDCELSFFTGKIDANGVEVFSGDITKAMYVDQSLYDCGDHRYGLVAWRGDCFCEVYTHDDGSEYFEPIDTERTFVVGNKFQNIGMLNKDHSNQ